MKNILYISHTSQLGGAERSLLLLLERLDRARFNPAVDRWSSGWTRWAFRGTRSQ